MEPPHLEFESFLGTVPGMIYRSRLAPPPYSIEFVSDEMTAIAGYPASDFMGREPKRVWAELVHPDDQGPTRQKLVGAPADGTTTEVEYRVRRADGTYAWILSRFRKVAADDGTLWAHGAAFDVTARHEAEELRRRLEAQQARTEEIEASGVRIVEAGDEARRRLERDLHDGAQQRLVIALMTLRRAAKEATGTPAETLVAESVEHLQQGLTELRELARGIHPSLLGERGLAAALSRLVAGSPLRVELDVVEERLPQTIETAVYFTVAEALTNAAKHSGAATARVEVAVTDGVVMAEIRDDGGGGASPTGGSGLRGLVDRLGALGGTVEVESPPGRGTSVRARLPLP